MGETNERFCPAHPRLAQDLGHLYPSHAPDGKQHLLNLGTFKLLGGVHEQIIKGKLTAFEVALGIGAGETHPVSLFQSPPSLLRSPLWCSP
jgi:hypothetical protein